VKVFLDILTPKQCMLFSRLTERLEEEGHQVLKTTRKYREVVQLLRLKGIDAKIVGEHGGGSLAGKLRASAERTLKLTFLMEKWKPDVAVSFSSPEAARVAYGLGIPHVCVNDSPHAEAVARLTVPLSKRLLTPKVIPKKAWVKFGISADRIVQFNALDAWAWLRVLKPNEGVLKQLGLDRSKPILTFRTEETFAAYLLGKTSEKPLIIPIIERLLKASKDFQMVVIPRYEEQVSALREVLGENAVICDSTIDGPSLLSFTSIFVGAGGTMTIEAALLGVPTFSCYPDKPFLIERYLINKELIVRETSPEQAAEKIVKTFNNLELAKAKQKEKAQKLTKNFEDPIEVIASTVKNVARTYSV